MSGDTRSELKSCLQLMMGPLVKFCLKHGISVQDFIESARLSFVKGAADEMLASGKKVNISRLSVTTGLQRKAIERIYREGETKENVSRIDKVIGQWRYDRRFTSKSRRPKILSCDGDDSDFHRLVRSVARELHPASVLFEMERIGAVERTENGVKLKSVAFEPRASAIEGMKLLARDMQDMLTAVLDNIEAHDQQSLPNFHAASVFDNLSEEDLPKVRSWLSRACSNFHTRVERFLASKDLDVNPSKNKAGGKRVVFTSFTRTQ